jgi:hypothetical protein
MTNTITIESATRTATVPVTCRVVNRTTRTVAGQAVVAMLHAWNTASACHALKNLQAAADETLTYASSRSAAL